MNKAFLTTVMLLCCVTGACQTSRFLDDYVNVDVSPERLREINTFDFEAAAAQDTAEPPSSSSETRPTTPPAELEITLEQCRVHVLQNNLNLKVQLIAPTIAKQSITEEEARFESLFFADVGYHKTDTPTSTTLSGAQVDAFDTNLGVNVPLRTGGSLQFNTPSNRTATDNVFAILDPAYTTDFSASISHNLLRGAGLRANSHAIRVVSYDTQASEAQTKLEVLRVLAAADRVYWRLYATRKELEVRVQEHAFAVAQFERAKRMVEAGATAEIEAIRAEAAVAERLEAIIIAENNVRDRQRDLKRIMNQDGIEMSGPTILIPLTAANPIDYKLDPATIVTAALKDRMELLELELQLASDASTIDFQRNQTLPLATLDYTYNVNGLGGSYNDSFTVLNDKNFEDHRLSARIEIPLGNEAAKSRLRRSLFARLQRLASREQRRAQIEQEVLNAIDQLEAAWQRILASRHAAILADRTLTAEQRQFELGLNTSNDVLDAQTRRADAQSAEVRALAEYQIAQVDLVFATGNILGASQIRWDPYDAEDAAVQALRK